MDAASSDAAGPVDALVAFDFGPAPEIPSPPVEEKPSSSICVDPDVPGISPRPLWGRIVQPGADGGEAIPDYVEVSRNFNLVKSLKILASVMTKASKRMRVDAEDPLSGVVDAFPPEATGHCICNGCSLQGAAATAWEQAEQQVQALFQGDGANLPPIATFLQDLIDHFLKRLEQGSIEALHEVATVAPIRWRTMAQDRAAARVNEFLAACQVPPLPAQDVADLTAQVQDLAQTFRDEMGDVLQALREVDLPALRQQVGGLLDDAKALWKQFRQVGSLGDLLDKTRWDSVRSTVQNLVPRARAIAQQMAPLADALEQAVQNVGPSIQQTASQVQGLQGALTTLAQAAGSSPCAQDAQVLAAHLATFQAHLQQDLQDVASTVAQQTASDLREVGRSVLEDGLSDLQGATIDALEQQVVQPYLNMLNNGLEGCHLRDTRAACDHYCQAYQGTLVWLPNDYFKTPRVTPSTVAQAGLFVLKQIGWLDQVVQGIQQSGSGGALMEGIGQAAQVVGSAAEMLANFADLLERFLKHVDTFTEGYHLGAYDTLRPRLHQCVGYAGHGTFAQMGNIGGSGFRIGARYTSHNLSRSHRVQVRTGGFGVSVLGRSLSLAPSIEINTQIEGWRLWDPTRPFGLPVSTQVTVGQIGRYDLFHLVDAGELQAAGLVDQSGHVNLFVRPLYPTTYLDDQGQTRVWPRPEVLALVPSEGSSTAVFGAGLNFDPKLKPIRKDLPTIQIWPPWVTATPWFQLAAALEWFFQANRFLDRILEQVNRNLPPADRLTPDDLKRDMHAFQAPDLTGDDGTSVTVEPSAGVDLTVGFSVWKVRFGVTLGLGLEVSIEPGGAGGIVDLNASLVDTLRHSNPPEEAPCSPVYVGRTSYQCNNRLFRDSEGQSISQADYSCVAAGEGSCCIQIACDPKAPQKCQEIGRKLGVEWPLALCLDAWTGIDKQVCALLNQGQQAQVIQAIQVASQWLGYMPFGTVPLREALVAIKNALASFQVTGTWGSSRCAHSECQTAFSTGWINQSPPTECETHGYCLGGDGTTEHDRTEGQCGKEATFVPYQCVKTIEEDLDHWEGAGCSPLQHGYPSACGCLRDQDCVEGLEVCDPVTGRCASASTQEAISCLCDGGACPPGRDCVDGACMKPCAQDDECPGPQVVCAQGHCRPTASIPTAEQVVSGIRGVGAPMHAVSTYAMSTLDFTSRFRMHLTIGAEFKIFGKKRSWKILELAKAWNIGHPTSKAWYQPGLEARYQHQCQSVEGEGVTNYFPHGRTDDTTGLLDLAGATDPQLCLAAANVCRYPAEGAFFAQYPDFVPPDQVGPRNTCSTANPEACELASFLDWCTATMPGRVSDPHPSTSEDIWQGVSDTVAWGEDVGMDLWGSAQLCINGKVWTQALLALPGNLEALDCRYTDPRTAITWTFPCADIHEQMLRIWGCLDVHGTVPYASQMATYPGAQVFTQWQGRDVLVLDALFDPVPIVDPNHVTPNAVEWDLSPQHLKPAIRQYFQPPLGVNLADLWVQGLADCFDRRYQDPLETRCECQQDADCLAWASQGQLVRCAAGACEAFGDGPDGAATWQRMQCPVVELGVEVVAGPCCGDGKVEWTQDLSYVEECDDGNLVDGDGCSSLCRIEGEVGPPSRMACVDWMNPQCEPRQCRLPGGEVGRCARTAAKTCDCL